MKKLNKRKVTLSLDKLQIAKLNNHSAIKGGQITGLIAGTNSDTWPTENGIAC